MSAIMGSYSHEMDASYAADFSRDREPMKTRSRHPEYRRKGSAPTRVSGMHCRRQKRWTWGSGRGARMTNLRAFASCVAVAVLALATQSIAAPVAFDWATIGNPGNSANIVSGTAIGAVASEFRMAKQETTNAQYVDFLNAVDQDGSNSRGLYNSSSGSLPLYGITLNAGAPAGSKYAVKDGGPTGVPAGTTYANMPVNYVSWFSAARFVNWFANGQLSGTAGTASMDTGTYNIASGTSGPIVTRNPSAQYFLPSADQWYKAAFYNGTSGTYTQYQTNSNTLPVASTNLSGTNTGNVSNINNGTNPNPIAVGSYVNVTSAYGLYDMLGNVVEMTDTINTANSSQYRAFGGGYGGNIASWNALSTPVFSNSTLSNPNYGFRMATSTVAPVPEPETITLAAFGIVGLCGANWLKRRRKAGQPGGLLAA